MKNKFLSKESCAALWQNGLRILKKCRGRFQKQDQQKEEKDPLLQSYFSSLLSLVLCVAMFLGTSYAWFTSEVNNQGNEFYIGILDVGFHKEIRVQENGQEKSLWQDLEDQTLQTNTLFNSAIRWEPGYTALETICVTQNGDLDFKYQLSLTDGTLAVPEGVLPEKVLALADVAKYFDVWVCPHGDGEFTKPVSYDQVKEENGWISAGTLDQLLMGMPVLEGAMEAPEPQPAAQAEAETTATEPNAEPQGDRYTIALHMNENATAEVMKHKITLNVKLVAYQVATEDDSLTAEATKVKTISELKNELTRGGTTLMENGLTIAKAERVTMNNGVLDGGGWTLTYKGGRNDSGSSLGVVTTTGGTVRNLTIKGGEDGRALYIEELKSHLLVSNCDLDGVYSFNLSSSKQTDYVLNFTGTIFRSWTSYANVTQMVNFSNCRFENVLKPYGDTTLTGCTFIGGEGNGLDVSALEAGETVTLTDCNYMGVTVKSAVVKNVDGNIKLEGADQLAIHENMIILAPVDQVND